MVESSRATPSKKIAVIDAIDFSRQSTEMAILAAGFEPVSFHAVDDCTKSLLSQCACVLISSQGERLDSLHYEQLRALFGEANQVLSFIGVTTEEDLQEMTIAFNHMLTVPITIDKLTTLLAKLEEQMPITSTPVLEYSVLQQLREDVEAAFPVILQAAIADCQKFEDELSQCQFPEDASQLAKIAHAVKGSFSAFGARKIVNICQDAENQVKQGVNLILDERRAEMINALHEVCHQLTHINNQ